MTREEQHDLKYLIRKYDHTAKTYAKNAQQERKYGDPKKADRMLLQQENFQLMVRDLEQFLRMHGLPPEPVPVLLVPSEAEEAAGITT